MQFLSPDQIGVVEVKSSRPAWSACPELMTSDDAVIDSSLSASIVKYEDTFRGFLLNLCVNVRVGVSSRAGCFHGSC